MTIKATILIDDDRWAKHPFEVKFDNLDCEAKYGKKGLDGWNDCYKLIERARNDGFDIDNEIDEYFY